MKSMGSPLKRKCLNGLTTGIRNITVASDYGCLSSFPPSLFLVTTLDNTFNTQQHRNASSRRRIRRRRDGVETVDSDGGEKEEGGTKNETIRIVKDRARFLQASSTFLTKATAALEPMKAYNDVFKIQRSTNEHGETLTLSLKPSEGQYVLQVYNELCTVGLRSPMSGNYTYVLCENTGKFVGMEDSHSIEGMIVRDLIRHCNGLPKF